MRGCPQLVFLGMALGSTAAAKTHICWIDHVVLEGSGVRVLFSRAADGHSGFVSGQRFTIENAMITWSSTKSAPKTEQGLLLAKGDSASVHGIPEDSCIISVVEVNGWLGVIAQAAVSIVGNPPQRSKEFIAAD